MQNSRVFGIEIDDSYPFIELDRNGERYLPWKNILASAYFATRMDAASIENTIWDLGCEVISVQTQNRLQRTKFYAIARCSMFLRKPNHEPQDVQRIIQCMQDEWSRELREFCMRLKLQEQVPGWIELSNCQPASPSEISDPNFRHGFNFPL